ncbi:hypothetical protein LCGC14_3129420, partial [marine sediment metagenome]
HGRDNKGTVDHYLAMWEECRCDELMEGV